MIKIPLFWCCNCENYCHPAWRFWGGLVGVTLRFWRIEVVWRASVCCHIYDVTWTKHYQCWIFHRCSRILALHWFELIFQCRLFIWLNNTTFKRFFCTCLIIRGPGFKSRWLVFFIVELHRFQVFFCTHLIKSSRPRVWIPLDRVSLLLNFTSFKCFIFASV